MPVVDMAEAGEDAREALRAVADVGPATRSATSAADNDPASLATGDVRARVAVPAGPFEREPVELGCALMTGRDGRQVSGAKIVQGTTAWLLAALADAGVELGAADRTIVGLIAGEGWSVAQVVGGWVTRAHR